jgi:hypothetical protein
MINPDKHFMQRCIELSKISLDQGDAPFGSLYQNSFQLPHINRFSLDFYSLKNNTIAQVMQ